MRKIALHTACWMILLVVLAEADAVGVRPYELDWAGRVNDDHPALIDFENLEGWSVECDNAKALFSRSNEEKIWGDYVGKIVYRADGKKPSFMIKPKVPLKTGNDFDAVSLWVYGNRFLSYDKSTPSVRIYACFVDGAGKPFEVRLINTRWKQWFLCHQRLSTEQIDSVKKGGVVFSGFRIDGGTNSEDRTLYFDSFCVFKEEFKALTFTQRAKRGVRVFAGRDQGANIGEGTLPFPNRAKTIVPKTICSEKPEILRGEQSLHMRVKGGLSVEIPLESFQWDGLRIRCKKDAAWIYPAVGGGIFFADQADKVIQPEKIQLLDVKIEDSGALCWWKVVLGERECVVSTTWWLEGQSLVADIAVEGGVVQEVRFGSVRGMDHPRLVTLPYYTYGSQERPAIAVGGVQTGPLFLAQHVDWTLSNASMPFALNDVQDNSVVINGGARYVAKTNGERNSCYERFVFSLSSEFKSVLPEIPNPVSPWKHVTGRGIWRAHGASNRANDIAFWRDMHRYGLREIIITDHETGWRDEHESFTFRTKAAPKKGGDKGQYDYARVMQDELGYVYGPYNNYTDFAPVNEYWSSDLIGRMPDNQLHHAWARCYAPKPLRGLEYCEKLAPLIEKKFKFSTAYCDVHTAVTPWSRTDYDWRVPGAGTFAQTFYAYGEIMLLQKQAWDGPVYSEGNNHFPYCGLTDGNYAQDQHYNLRENPWLVDFDLLKMHDLCCNFGVGNVGMFFGRKADLGSNKEEVRASLDRFLAATIAFGHPGFMLRTGGIESTLRSYYMLQQIQERYTQVSVKTIQYYDGSELLSTSAAVTSGAYKRSQLVVEYEGGVNVVVNGSLTDNFVVQWKDRTLSLPPNGYAAWSDDGEIEVFSGLHEGRRIDYCRSPKYIYIDGRGEYIHYDKAAASGLALCRFLSDGGSEIISINNHECGFAVSAASALALDRAGEEINVANLRSSRGFTHIVPVEGSFSYKLMPAAKEKAVVALACDATRVFPGKRVKIREGEVIHEITIPADAAIGKHFWKRIGDQWIDFVVAPLCEIDAEVSGNGLKISITPNFNTKNSVLQLKSREHELVMQKGKQQLFEIPIVRKNDEVLKRYGLEIKAADIQQHEEFMIYAEKKYRQLTTLPSDGDSGMSLKKRGRDEPISDESGARVTIYAEMSCDEVMKKNVLFMHPPYRTGIGYVYQEYKQVALPKTAAAVRGFVGKRDGSDLGDGIFFRVEVKGDEGWTVAGSAHVIKHEWRRIEADLSAWSGKTVDLRLITDAGKNTNGDWGGWAEMWLETLNREVIWSLLPEAGSVLSPSPHPLPGITRADLRGAKKGYIRYEGIGLAGKHPVYGTFGLLNGFEIGDLKSAAGSERNNIWSKMVEIPITAEAIGSLALHNVFEIFNPGNDYFKLRNICIVVELADGRTVATLVHAQAISQPGSWLYAEGVGVAQGDNIKVDLWFADEF